MLARIAPSFTRVAAARAAVPRTLGAPRFYSKPTQSEEASKAHHNKDSPEELQRKTAQQHQEDGTGATSAGKANETHSEEAVHGAKHDKSPEQLQKETAGKA